MAKAILENYNGAPAIMINDKPYPPMMGTITCFVGTETVEGQAYKEYGIELKEDYVKRLGDSGVKIFFIMCNTEWLRKDNFYWLKKQADIILSQIPDAYFMIRIGLHPPVEWLLENPDEMVLFSDGTHEPFKLRTEAHKKDYPGMYSLCSKKWREDAGKALLETYDLVEKSDFGDRVIGYFLAAGNTSEWYYSGVHKNGAYSDISPAFLSNFEEYLRETYKTEEDLKSAWNDPEATFSNPKVPDFSERVHLTIDDKIKNPANTKPTQPVSAPPKTPYNIGVFTNMNTSKKTYDFYRAWHIGTAKSVNYFAKLIKERSKNKLVGAFYGSTGCVDFITSSTSAAALNILDDGNVDFFAAPTVYQNIQIGGFAGIREPADSFRLRNQMFIVEEDTRTHNENAYFADLYEVFSVEDTLNIMKRDFGRDLSEDLQAWWFDQHISGGRYDGKEVLDLITRQQKIAAESYEKDRKKKNEIAFIYDEESINALSQRANFYTIEFMRDYEVSRIGASADMYYHNDLARDDMPSYKLYVFCNCFVLSEKEREDILKKLKKDNATAVWFYAPGVIDPENKPFFDPSRIKELTGINVEMDEVVISPKFKISGEHEILNNLDRGEIYGRNYRYRLNNMTLIPIDDTQLLYPAFSVKDDTAKALGNFLVNKKVSFALKEMDGWNSIYIGSQHVRSDVIREIARFAGCHIFCETDDIIYSGEHYITIHAGFTGEKTLKFKKPCSPFEVYEEKCYGENVAEISFKMLKGETKTFKLD